MELYKTVAIELNLLLSIVSLFLPPKAFFVLPFQLIYLVSLLPVILFQPFFVVEGLNLKFIREVEEDFEVGFKCCLRRNATVANSKHKHYSLQWSQDQVTTMTTKQD